MVKHYIIWSLKDGFSESKKNENALKIKKGLEGLKGVIPGLLDIRVTIDLLPSSSGSLMLDSTFTDNEALKAYQVNPQHLKVAQFVRSVTQNRQSADFEA